MDGRLQHTVIDDTNTPATGPRSYSTIKLKKGEFFLAEDLTSFKVGDGTKTYESITEDNTYYAGKGAGSAYKFKLNGTTYPSGTLPEYTKDLSNNGIYAPLSGGSGNQVLISLGNNTAPTWADVNISDGLGIINPVGDTYNLILRASSSGHLGGVYSDYSNLFLNNYRVLSSGQSNTDPNYPEVTIFAPTTSTTSASGASISNQLLISQADNQAPIWTGLTLNGSTNGKYLKWDNGWTLDNAGGGTNAYVHIKYANSSNPQDSDMHNIPAVGDKYIGVYSGSASVAPTDHASYVWSKYVGEDGTGVAIKANAESCTQLGDGYINQNQSSATYGHLMVLTSLSPRTFADAGEIKGPKGDTGATGPQGPTGPTGANGQDGNDGEDGADGDSIFLRYSTSSTGNPMHTTFQQGDKYIGIYTGQSAPEPYSSYTWCKFIGDDGSAVGDTWRDIKVDGTQILNTTAGGAALNLVKGNNITLTPETTSSSYTGKVTIAATDTKYKFKLNGGSYVGDGTDLSSGGIYAPTSAGNATDKYLYWNNNSGHLKPEWGSLTTVLGHQTDKYVLVGKGNNTDLSWEQLSLESLSDTPTENKITLNGTDNAKFLRSNGTSGNIAFYAPTNGQPNSGGNSNQLLLSQGTNHAPIWSSFTFPSSGTKVLSYTNGSWSLEDPSPGGTDTHRIVKARGANEQASATILLNSDNKSLELIAGDNIDLDYGSPDLQGNYTGTVTIHGPDYQINNYSGTSGDVFHGCYGRIGYTVTVGSETSSTVAVPITMSARGGIPSGTSSTIITGTSDTSIDELSFIAGTNISFRKLTSAGYRSGLIIDANATISIATANNSPNGLVVSYDATFTNISNYPGHYVGIPIYYDDNEKKHVVNLWDIITALQVDNKENKDLLAALQSLLNT